MFLRIDKRPNVDRTVIGYRVRLVEAARVGGKPRQKFIATLGTYRARASDGEPASHAEDLIFWFDFYDRLYDVLRGRPIRGASINRVSQQLARQVQKKAPHIPYRSALRVQAEWLECLAVTEEPGSERAVEFAHLAKAAKSAKTWGPPDMQKRHADRITAEEAILDQYEAELRACGRHDGADRDALYLRCIRAAKQDSAKEIIQ